MKTKEYFKEYYKKNRAKKLQASKKWRKNNKERDKINQQKWIKSNPEKIRKYSDRAQISARGVYNSIKSNAWKKSLFLCRFKEFSQWYNQEKKQCIYCDLPVELIHLDKKRMSGGVTAPRLTIERMNNNKGYETSNLALACRSCNVVKNNILSYEDMLWVGQKIIKPKWEREV